MDFSGLKSLMQSRKFWLTLLAWIAAAGAFVQHQIDAESFVTATVALVGVLISTIAYEDAHATVIVEQEEPGEPE